MHALLYTNLIAIAVFSVLYALARKSADGFMGDFAVHLFGFGMLPLMLSLTNLIAINLVFSNPAFAYAICFYPFALSCFGFRDEIKSDRWHRRAYNLYAKKLKEAIEAHLTSSGVLKEGEFALSLSLRRKDGSNFNAKDAGNVVVEARFHLKKSESEEKKKSIQEAKEKIEALRPFGRSVFIGLGDFRPSENSENQQK